MRKKQNLIWIIYIIELLIVYVMQQIKIFSPEIFGGKALYLIPCFVFIAVYEKEYAAMIFGALTGLLIDIGYGELIGIEAIILCILGYMLGKISYKFIRANIITHFIYTTIIAFLVLGSQFLFFYAMRGYGDYKYAFTNHYLPCIIYTSIISPIVYLFNRSLYYAIKRGEEI